MENPIKMDDLGGKPIIFGNIHITLNNQLRDLDIFSFLSVFFGVFQPHPSAVKQASPNQQNREDGCLTWMSQEVSKWLVSGL